MREHANAAWLGTGMPTLEVFRKVSQGLG